MSEVNPESLHAEELDRQNFLIDRAVEYGCIDGEGVPQETTLLLKGVIGAFNEIRSLAKTHPRLFGPSVTPLGSTLSSEIITFNHLGRCNSSATSRAMGVAQQPLVLEEFMLDTLLQAKQGRISARSYTLRTRYRDVGDEAMRSYSQYKLSSSLRINGTTTWDGGVRSPHVNALAGIDSKSEQPLTVYDLKGLKKILEHWMYSVDEEGLA